MLTFQFSVLVWLKRDLYRIKFNGRLNKRDTVVQSTLCLSMMMVVLFICTHLHALHLEASWVCASLCIVISERFLLTHHCSSYEKVVRFPLFIYCTDCVVTFSPCLNINTELTTYSFISYSHGTWKRWILILLLHINWSSHKKIFYKLVTA